MKNEDIMLLRHARLPRPPQQHILATPFPAYRAVVSFALRAVFLSHPGSIFPHASRRLGNMRCPVRQGNGRRKPPRGPCAISFATTV